MPSKNCGTDHKAINVTQTSGADRNSHGRNLPLGFLFLAKLLSINAPIKGSLIKSQTFQIINKIPNKIGSIFNASVQYIVNVLPITANVIHPPASPRP